MHRLKKGKNPKSITDFGKDVLAHYPDDSSYPSVLLLAFVEDQPIHIVVAKNQKTEQCYVVTVYRQAEEAVRRNTEVEILRYAA